MMRVNRQESFLLIATCVLGCCLTCCSPLLAVPYGEQHTLKSGSAAPKERSANEVPDLKDLKLPPSDVRGMIERYAVDRANGGKRAHESHEFTRIRKNHVVLPICVLHGLMIRSYSTCVAGRIILIRS